MIENRFELLDCSLRDGGYYNDWNFEPAFAEEYLRHLNDLPIDYVEIGYRSKPKNGYLGAYFYCPGYVLEHAAQTSSKKLAIILNEKEIEAKDVETLLEPCHGIITMIRIAVAPSNILSSIKIAEEIKKLGFEVSFNVMYVSTWGKEKEFLKNLDNLQDLADYFYLVDSYGSIYPHEVREIIDLVKSKTKVKIGFHAHNNLEMGLINSLTALECGASIIDSTIAGMGRGAGNLKTELLLTTLQAKGLRDVNYDHLSRVVTLFEDLKDKHRWGTNLAYMVSGANSLPQQQVMSQMSKRYYSLNSIVRGVFNKSKGIKDNIDLRELDSSKSYDNAVIIGGGPTGITHARAVTSFVKKIGNCCLIHVSSKNAAAYKDVQQLQYHCLVGNEGHRLEKVFKDLENSTKTAVLPPYPRTMGTYVPDALKANAYQLKKINFTEENTESVTALAIETALTFNVRNLYFVGYDGYEGEISAPEMELFKENEGLFQALKNLGVKYCALTPTKYSRLQQESVFAYIS